MPAGICVREALKLRQLPTGEGHCLRAHQNLSGRGCFIAAATGRLIATIGFGLGFGLVRASRFVFVDPGFASLNRHYESHHHQTRNQFFHNFFRKGLRFSAPTITCWNRPSNRCLRPNSAVANYMAHGWVAYWPQWVVKGGGILYKARSGKSEHCRCHHDGWPSDGAIKRAWRASVNDVSLDVSRDESGHARSICGLHA